MRLIILIVILSFTQITAQDLTPKLVSFQPSNCNSEDAPSRLRQRIISTEYNNGNLLIEVAVVANCFIEHTIGKINVINDKLFLFYYKEEKETTTTVDGDTVVTILTIQADCECCFSFTYFIEGVNKEFNFYALNYEEIKHDDEKYKTYPIQFEINEDSDTINFIDKYGLKQGIWIDKEYVKNPKYKLFYVDDKIQSGLKPLYYKNGMLRGEIYWKDFKIIKGIHFYESGYIKRVCKTTHETNCVDFKESDKKIMD